MKVYQSVLSSSAKLFPSVKVIVVLFFCGLCLGVTAHYIDRLVHRPSFVAGDIGLLSQVTRVISGTKSGALIPGATSPGEARASLTTDTSFQSRQDKERTIGKGLSFGKGLSILLDAIKDPKSADFSLIRSEYLQSIPNYSAILLPPLKEASLNVMISKFDRTDWDSWPKSSFLKDGAPTNARQYVDSIQTQNRELGLFLETSALLLHGLYVTTNHGGVYDITRGFDYLVGSAEKLIHQGDSSAVPAKYQLSYSVTGDPSFLPTFERIRSSLVAEYVAAHGDELERNLRLLSSLDGRYQTESSSEQLSQALLRLSKDGTPRFRKQIVDMLVESGQLDQVFLLSTKVKTSAAHLVAVTAVDALEQKDVVLAKTLLSHSLSLANGLPAQKLVGDFLREYGFGWVRPTLSPLEKKDLEPAKKVVEETGAKFTIFGVSMILLLLVGGLIAFLFIRKKITQLGLFSSEPFVTVEPDIMGSSLPYSRSYTKDKDQSQVAETPRKVVNYQNFIE